MLRARPVRDVLEPCDTLLPRVVPRFPFILSLLPLPRVLLRLPVPLSPLPDEPAPLDASPMRMRFASQLRARCAADSVSLCFHDCM